MSGFLYLLPGVSVDKAVRAGRFSAELLRDRGLADVLADVADVPDDVVVTEYAGRGAIDCEPGVVLYPKSAAGDSPRAWGVAPDLQTWEPRDSVAFRSAKVAEQTEQQDATFAERKTTVWIGWETDRPPGPEDLVRNRVCQGDTAKDRAGQEWTIPIARSPRGRDTLPADYVRSDAGVDRVVDPDYRALWELAGQVRDWVYDCYEPPQPVAAWKWDTALAILQANYRVATPELNLLQRLGRAVLTTDTLERVLCAVIDYDLPKELIELLQKKTGET